MLHKEEFLCVFNAGHLVTYLVYCNILYIIVQDVNEFNLIFGENNADRNVFNSNRFKSLVSDHWFWN